MTRWFESPEWLILEIYGLDEEAASEPGLAGDFQVTYSDNVAVDFADLVEQSIAVVANFAGVTRVMHDDRETLKVWGEVDLSALDEALRQWWANRASDRD